MPTLLLVVVFIVLFIFAGGYYFFRVAFYPEIYSVEETLNLELDNNRLLGYAEMQTWEREEIHIRSPHGYDLFGYFYPIHGSMRTVVISHGITISLFGSLKYIPLFRKHGFNVVVYDNRFHGRSGGSACSFGFFEKYDLKAVVDWAFARTGPGTLVGTNGESLGAAITLQHAAIDPRIAFAIPDCPFSNLEQLFRIRLKRDYHLPPFPLIPLCGWFAKILLKFDYQACSPISRIDSIQTPILFIHGDMDTYIPPSMSVDMFQKKMNGDRMLYIAKGAKHAESLVINREEYQRQVDHFLATIGVITPRPQP